MENGLFFDWKPDIVSVPSLLFWLVNLEGSFLWWPGMGIFMMGIMIYIFLIGNQICFNTFIVLAGES